MSSMRVESSAIPVLEMKFDGYYYVNSDVAVSCYVGDGSKDDF